MPRPRIRILVASSERKNPGGERTVPFKEAQGDRASNRYTSLTHYREGAISKFLSAINGRGHAEEVLGLKGKRLEEAVATNLRFNRSALLPMIDRDRGPFFTSLDPMGLPDGLRKRLCEELLIFCPLLGIVAPADLVPEYRCPIGAQLPGFGSLHQYWKERLPRLLNRLCRGRRVFSFLPTRVRALWSPGRGVASFIQIQFGRPREPGSSIRGPADVRIENAGAAGLSGLLTRAILSGGLDDVERVKTFRSPEGHTFCQSASVEEGARASLVFVR